MAVDGLQRPTFEVFTIMLSRFARVFAVCVMVAVPATSFAGGPRIHRGPTSPKLFKERTARPLAPKPVAASAAEPRATEMKAAEIEQAEPSSAADKAAERIAYPANN